jgi:hypothetical protein
MLNCKVLTEMCKLHANETQDYLFMVSEHYNDIGNRFSCLQMGFVRNGEAFNDSNC